MRKGIIYPVITVGLLFLMFGPGLRAQLLDQPVDDPAIILQQAHDAYETGDYPAAIQLYEGLVEASQADAIVYFNLGNAYFESADPGHALVNYRRAQRLIPRDGELIRNLAITRAVRVDVAGDETDPLNTLAVATESLLTNGELALIVFMLWVLWFTGLAVWLVHPALRGQLRLLLIVGGIIVAVGLVLLSSRLYVESQRPPAVVVAFQTEMMSGPGQGYVPLFTLYSAAEGYILAQQAGWVRFQLPDGRQGWLPADAIIQI